MEMQQAGHPSMDDTLRILMVGNSFCYYYVEELYGLLMANPDPNRGYNAVQIYNLYYTGCTLTRHYDWWINGGSEYQLYKTDAAGRNELPPSKEWTLEAALAHAPWDYISLQGTVKGGNYSKDETSVLAAAICEKELDTTVICRCIRVLTYDCFFRKNIIIKNLVRYQIGNHNIKCSCTLLVLLWNKLDLTPLLC